MYSCVLLPDTSVLPVERIAHSASARSALRVQSNLINLSHCSDVGCTTVLHRKPVRSQSRLVEDASIDGPPMQEESEASAKHSGAAMYPAFEWSAMAAGP